MSAHPSSPRPKPAGIESILENKRHFLTFLRRRLPDAATAEDVFQQGILRGLRQQDSLRDTDRLVPWFYSILRNAVTDFYRARAAESRKMEGLSRESGGEETGAGFPPFEVAEAELCRCFNGLLPALKPEYATLLDRIELRGESVQEVAAELGITVNNLGVRLHRARQALRKSLEKTCGACTEHGCLDCTCRV